MQRSNVIFIITGLAIALFLAIFISPFASSDPDGLEKVAKDKGFIEHAEGEGATLWESSPIPDYAIPGIKNEKIATGLAGLIGTVIIFLIGVFFAKVLSKDKKTHKNIGREFMKKGRILSIILVCVAILGFAASGYCHQPRTEGEAVLSFSGYLNVEASYSHLNEDGTSNDTDASDIYVDEFGLSISAGLAEDVSADATILYEENEDDSEVVVDEAYLSILKGNLYCNFGKIYIPFADADTGFIVDSYAHDLGETRESAILLGTNIKNLNIELGVFNGDYDEAGKDDKVTDFFGAIKLTLPKGETTEISIGASYISDITDTDAGLLLPAATYTDKVDGYSVCASITARTGSLSVEYVSAADDITDLGPDVQPEALNVELMATHIETRFYGFKYEETKDFTSIINNQELIRWGFVYGLILNEKADLKFEYLRDEDDRDNILDTITAQLGYKF